MQLKVGCKLKTAIDDQFKMAAAAEFCFWAIISASINFFAPNLVWKISSLKLSDVGVDK